MEQSVAIKQNWKSDFFCSYEFYSLIIVEEFCCTQAGRDWSTGRLSPIVCLGGSTTLLGPLVLNPVQTEHLVAQRVEATS